MFPMLISKGVKVIFPEGLMVKAIFPAGYIKDFFCRQCSIGQD